MKKAKKTPKPTMSRIERELRETATGFHAVGLIDDATYRKITMRDVKKGEGPGAATLAPLSPDEIRALRESANMSQAVFAQRLHMSVSYLSDLERGVKRATGTTMVLFEAIRRNGIDVIAPHTG
jgi:putative transcriptional regulator